MGWIQRIEVAFLDRFIEVKILLVLQELIVSEAACVFVQFRCGIDPFRTRICAFEPIIREFIHIFLLRGMEENIRRFHVEMRQVFRVEEFERREDRLHEIFEVARRKEVVVLRLIRDLVLERLLHEIGYEQQVVALRLLRQRVEAILQNVHVLLLIPPFLLHDTRLALIVVAVLLLLIQVFVLLCLLQRVGTACLRRKTQHFHHELLARVLSKTTHEGLIRGIQTFLDLEIIVVLLKQFHSSNRQTILCNLI